LFRAKPKILVMHRWLALIAGLFLLCQGVTGTLVAFRYELNRLLHPGVMTIAPSTRHASLAGIVAAARHALPDSRVARVDYPRRPDDAFIVRMTGTDGALSIATVGRDGHVLRAAPIRRWPVEAAYQLHENMMIGEPGQRGIGFVGVSLLVLAVSGLFYWWPAPGRFRKALAQTLSPKLAGPRVAREWHRAIGLIAAAYLALMACLGIAMAWSPWIRPLVAFVAPVTAGRSVAPHASCAVPIDVDAAVDTAVVHHPGQKIKSVRFPSKGRVVAVYFQSRVTYPPRFTDHVWIDACDGGILATDEASAGPVGDAFFNWLLPIHSGEWLGMPGRLLSWLSALALVLMGGLGYFLWLTRLKNQLRRRS
jgi:uncharacterized iron-regulated membrane protein